MLFPLIFAFINFLVWSVFLYIKYVNFGFYDWDLAIYSQACWRILHGSQFVTLNGINFFGDHSSFFIFVILPFFALFSSPITLLLLKAASFAVAIYLLHVLALERLGKNYALLLTTLYAFFPANIFALLYEFNLECFAPPILFLMYNSFEKLRWKTFFILAVVLMLIKENMCLVVCAFGVYALFKSSFPKKIGWATLVLGVVSFIVFVFFTIPYFRGLSHHSFIIRYEYLAEHAALALFNMDNALYLIELFGPMFILVIWGPHILLAFPIFAQHLLSNFSPEKSIYYYYGAVPAVFIFIAAIYGCLFLQSRLSQRVFKVFFYFLIAASLLYLASYKQEFIYRLNYHKDQLKDLRWSFVNLVPKNEGVMASFYFLAPLSARDNLNAFAFVYDEDYQNLEKQKKSILNVNKTFALPDLINYVLIDFMDLSLQYSFEKYPKQTFDRINAFLQNDGWGLVRAHGSIMLFKRFGTKDVGYQKVTLDSFIKHNETIDFRFSFKPKTQ